MVKKFYETATTDLKFQIQVFRTLFWFDSLLAVLFILAGSFIPALLLAILALQFCVVSNQKAVLISLNQINKEWVIE